MTRQRRCSTVVPDEHALSVLSAVTGSLTAFLQYVAVIADWATSRGIPEQDAQRYVRGLFAQLAGRVGEPDRPLARVVRDHETPGGLNEQLRRSWLDEANESALRAALDALLRRVEG